MGHFMDIEELISLHHPGQPNGPFSLRNIFLKTVLKKHW